MSNVLGSIVISMVVGATTTYFGLWLYFKERPKFNWEYKDNE